MILLVTIILFLIMFMLAFAGVWFWYYKIESATENGMYKRGLRAFRKQKFEKAEKIFNNVLKINAEHRESIYHIGLIDFKNKKYEKARGSFEQILQKDSKDFHCMFNIGLTFQMQGDFEKAEEFYIKTLKEFDKDFESYFNLGFIKFQAKLYENALAFFQRAQELMPKHIATAYYITRCKDELCKYDTKEEGQAIIEDYLKISQIQELPEDFELSLAKSYAKCGEVENALERCKRALKAQPENFEAYKLMGLIYLVKNDAIKAKTNLKTAVNLKPDDVELYELLPYAICRQKDKCEMLNCKKKFSDLVIEVKNKIVQMK